MTTRTASIGILAGLLLIYGVYAVGEFAQCYNAARHDPLTIITHGTDSTWAYCARLHLFHPFQFFP
jgi:hypothetical protein